MRSLPVFCATLLLTGAPAVCSAMAEAEFVALCEKEFPHLDQVQIAVVEEPLAYDFTQSAARLTQLSTQHAPGSTVLGETAVTLAYSAQYHFQTRADPATGQRCSIPRVELALILKQPTIRIAREFPRGSCSFAAVMHHELRHLQAWREQLQVTRNFLRTELGRALNGRVFLGDPLRLKAMLDEAIRDDWFPLAQQKLGEVRRLHTKIDTPTEYARNRQRCRGELLERLGGAAHY